LHRDRGPSETTSLNAATDSDRAQSPSEESADTPAEVTPPPTDTPSPTETPTPQDSVLASSGTSSPVVAPVTTGPLRVANITASCTAPDGVDAASHPVSYNATNAVDGDPRTAWRCADVNGETLVLDLGSPMVVTKLGLIAGYAKIDPQSRADRWAQNRRITAVAYTFEDGSTVQQKFNAEDRRVQTADIPPVVTQRVIVTVEGTTPGQKGFDYTAISEIEVEGGEP